MLLCRSSWLPETARKSSMEVISSTASVRTRTCFSHCSLKRSMFSWASLLCGFAAKASAALITCKHSQVYCLLFQSHENNLGGTAGSEEWPQLCLTYDHRDTRHHTFHHKHRWSRRRFICECRSNTFEIQKYSRTVKLNNCKQIKVSLNLSTVAATLYSLDITFPAFFLFKYTLTYACGKYN